ncbi:50S ribosomal protein L25/general stress protein Ctc [Bifidobacterium pseudolongum]|jgi:large subunit ribosomal protein L25|uniref:Large ribosomal subunit protein bL25 n=2 Tax=Bifidobacterium pseudolongum TaxID=1694 RepID=A0A0A7I7X2_9BIFI|nr:50S ribosomal protein L25/general stress protein Ctc [Bifidobacterium pseudolongum]AIZ16338.1 50S ribosomal protein L25 [Bifidobacterium pseudolongum PV8-2]ASW23854.1 ribosomal protein L25, Ctc-form [Bifidobacterium pseudolongum]MCH4835233.1 50S ribosomal protein L25/general stress protein Ctc [Bifidobacterium pseudolongum]MCH4856610.1 50S ribosomal protein L25/general stress protein Ctc [Bifidobacterium pseudolongum]MCH4860218.1 50S ribosomal protein L25/general stress protein Ctc [Bifidob
MANNTIVLEGELRTEFGKGPARRMRVAKEIPATVYAGGEQPVYLKLPMKDTTLALRHTNALITLKFGDESRMAVVKDVQRNPVKRVVEHVDFYEVKAGEKIDVEVPVFVDGTPKGAAIAFVDIQELKVRADVANLPERIVVDVNGLAEGDKVFLKDLEMPEGVELDMDDLEESVVTVEVPEEAPAADTDVNPADVPATAEKDDAEA